MQLQKRPYPSVEMFDICKGQLISYLFALMCPINQLTFVIDIFLTYYHLKISILWTAVLSCLEIFTNLFSFFLTTFVRERYGQYLTRYWLTFTVKWFFLDLGFHFFDYFSLNLSFILNVDFHCYVILLICYSSFHKCACKIWN